MKRSKETDVGRDGADSRACSHSSRSSRSMHVPSRPYVIQQWHFPLVHDADGTSESGGGHPSCPKRSRIAGAVPRTNSPEVAACRRNGRRKRLAGASFHGAAPILFGNLFASRGDVDLTSKDLVDRRLAVIEIVVERATVVVLRGHLSFVRCVRGHAFVIALLACGSCSVVGRGVRRTEECLHFAQIFVRHLDDALRIDVVRVVPAERLALDGREGARTLRRLQRRDARARRRRPGLARGHAGGSNDGADDVGGERREIRLGNCSGLHEGNDRRRACRMGGPEERDYARVARMAQRSASLSVRRMGMRSTAAAESCSPVTARDASSGRTPQSTSWLPIMCRVSSNRRRV